MSLTMSFHTLKHFTLTIGVLELETPQGHTNHLFCNIILKVYIITLILFEISINISPFFCFQAVLDTTQHSISYTLSRNQAIIVEYMPDEDTDMFQVLIFCFEVCKVSENRKKAKLYMRYYLIARLGIRNKINFKLICD